MNKQELRNFVAMSTTVKVQRIGAKPRAVKRAVAMIGNRVVISRHVTHGVIKTRICQGFKFASLADDTEVK